MYMLPNINNLFNLNFHDPFKSYKLDIKNSKFNVKEFYISGVI